MARKKISEAVDAFLIVATLTLISGGIIFLLRQSPTGLAVLEPASRGTLGFALAIIAVFIIAVGAALITIKRARKKNYLM